MASATDPILARGSAATINPIAAAGRNGAIRIGFRVRADDLGIQVLGSAGHRTVEAQPQVLRAPVVEFHVAKSISLGLLYSK